MQGSQDEVEQTMPGDAAVDSHEFTASNDATGDLVEATEAEIRQDPVALPKAMMEPIETGDVRVDSAVARLAECSTDDDAAAITVLTDVHDRLHEVLLNP